MPCTTCQLKYSFFTHEYECPNCGFSYCRKCLKYKHVLLNGDCKKVCGPCHNKLKMSSDSTGNSAASSSSMSSGELSSAESIKPLPFVDLQTKLNLLDNPAKAPIVIYKQERWDRLKTGMDPADQEIVDRLMRLKDKDKKPIPPTTEEIRRRLALLKDQDPDRIVPAKVNYMDKRSDQEKTDDLIREYLEKLELSATTDPDAELERRLKLLKGVDSVKPSLTNVNNADDEDEESLTKNIVAKAMADAALRAKYQDDDELEEMEVEAPKIDSDEEISCCMCEQTKDLVECTGCTGDLYCPICFEDNHDDFEMGKHKTMRFTPTKYA